MKRNNQYPLPDEWTWLPFGECAQLINGRAYAQHELLDQGTPVLRIQNLNGGDRWYYSNIDLPPEKYCQPGDLLFAWSATFGPYRWTGPKSIYHYHIWKVLPKPNLDQAFAFRLLQQITQQIKSAAHGVTMVHMTKGGMEEWKVPLPPIAEQKRIAAILDKAEELRSLRRQALGELDALTQSIFLEMFGDPVTNPKGWIKVDLGSVGDVKGGLQLSASRSKLPCKVPYLRVANVYRDVLNLHEIKTMYATESEVARTLLKPNDLLFVEGHGNPSEIGRCALWDGSIPTCIHQNHLIRLRFNLKKVNPVFVSRYLNSPGGRRDLLRAGKTTSGLNTISVSNVRNAQLLLPPLPLQQVFARRVEAIEQLKITHRESLAHLDTLFASLQHRAFRGEL